MFSSNTSAVSADANFIEDVFSTWLYTGNDATQAASTGINLSTKGGLVWTKRRNGAASHFLVDTVRGNNKPLSSNSSAAQTVAGVDYITPTTTGYTVENVGNINTTGETYASWTFAKQAKFFDVVTWTGDGNSSQTINHNLGSVPGCIMVKRLNNSGSWSVFHRSINSGRYGYALLNSTAAADPDTAYDWNPTSTTFLAATNLGTNANGGTYVAYLFAHDAGGFGLTSTDNVISCGSFTTDGSGFVPDVNLGYEPQWILLKQTNSANSWFMFDNMRGWSQTNSQYLYADSSGAEASWNGAAAQYYGVITPTGFKGLVSSGINNGTFIYIAIRRGPMKTPTTGTSVFNPVLNTANGSGYTGQTITTNFPVDMGWRGFRNVGYGSVLADRLRGMTAPISTAQPVFYLPGTSAESLANEFGSADSMTDYKIYGYTSSETSVLWNFRRATGFFDVVCYTGNATARTLNHNLGVVPEMMIGKSRSGTFDWCVYHKDVGNTKAIYLNGTGTPVTSLDFWNDTTPTASVFTIGTINRLNTNNATQVMYLFASCPGVSKVGSYTGTGALQTINCGFTGGARFVLIKRTDASGDWFVYDSARGISSGNDPYLLLNSPAAEDTGTNYVDTTSVGFQVTAAAPAGLNANGGTYIFLAIA